MPELTARERLQPSLLDRLTDHAPQTTRESRDQRVLSLSQVKAAVVRDLSWLLNTTSHREVEGWNRFPEVEKSVLNFGLRALAGTAASSTDVAELEDIVSQAIRRYEPRILPHSLTVRVTIDSEAYGLNALCMEIEGDLWADPMPEALYLRTELDLETGRFAVEER